MAKRVRPGILVGVVFLALAASPAHAATVTGSDFPAGGTGSSSSAERLFIQDAIDGSAVETPTGVITRWNLSGASGVFALEVFRHRSDTALVAGEIHAGFVAQSEVESAGPGRQSFATRIPVDLGDYIALHAGAEAGVTIRAAPGEQTWYFAAPPDATSVDQDASRQVKAEVFYQAIVEPDADGDDFGDETQDGCPSDPSTQGACPPRGGGSGTTPPGNATPPAPDPLAAIRASGPTVRIARTARATRRGVVSLEVTNPYAFALKGRVAVKRGRKSVARKGLALPSRATKTVKVRLRGAALRALRRRGRLKLKLGATLKGPVGKARTTRASVTAVVPRRRRVGRRPPGGGGGSIPEGTYTGSYTSQMSAAPGTSPLSFRVAGGQVVEFRTRVHVACTGSGIGSAIEEFNPEGGAAIAADGTFKTKFHDASDDQNFIYEGKVNSDGTASGKLTYQDFPLVSGSGVCVGAGPWTAKR